MFARVRIARICSAVTGGTLGRFPEPRWRIVIFSCALASRMPAFRMSFAVSSSALVSALVFFFFFIIHLLYCSLCQRPVERRVIGLEPARGDLAQCDQLVMLDVRQCALGEPEEEDR